MLFYTSHIAHTLLVNWNFLQHILLFFFNHYDRLNLWIQFNSGLAARIRHDSINFWRSQLSITMRKYHSSKVENNGKSFDNIHFLLEILSLFHGEYPTNDFNCWITHSSIPRFFTKLYKLYTDFTAKDDCVLSFHITVVHGPRRQLLQVKSYLSCLSPIISKLFAFCITFVKQVLRSLAQAITWQSVGMTRWFLLAQVWYDTLLLRVCLGKPVVILLFSSCNEGNLYGRVATVNFARN